MWAYKYLVLRVLAYLLIKLEEIQLTSHQNMLLSLGIVVFVIIDGLAEGGSRS